MGKQSRCKGVSPSGSRLNPWLARIKINGKVRYLGQYATEEEAAAAYAAALPEAMALRDRRKTQNTWRHRQTLARLTWQYGPERAARIMAGQDAQANADLASWNALGSRRAA